MNREEIVKKLEEFGVLPIDSAHDVRANNVGMSNYANHVIQPWSIILDWDLNPWDADIVKRTLRTKESDSRILDYEKIKHICDERIRQLRYASAN